MRRWAAPLPCLAAALSIAHAASPAPVGARAAAPSQPAPAAAPVAADAANGKLLYTNGPRAGGAPACASCHGASPITNAYGIRIAGGNPAEILHAFNSVVAMRSYQFATRFTPKEIADLAAFIDNPKLTPAPSKK
jgi:cytochrome c553